MRATYTARGRININTSDVNVEILYYIENDDVLLHSVAVEGTPADWLIDVFEDELTEICEVDFDLRAAEWARDAAEDMAEMRHDAELQYRGL